MGPDGVDDGGTPAGSRPLFIDLRGETRGLDVVITAVPPLRSTPPARL